MVAVCCFDIETTGLDRHACDITVVALSLYDTRRERVVRSFCFNLVLAREKSPDDEADIKMQIKTILNGSDVLLAYNGLSFDVPWLWHWCDGQDDALLDSWKKKTMDFLHEAKIRTNAFISMDSVAKENSIAVTKTATGKQAIIWAQAREWQLLEEYCVADTVVLLELFKTACIRGLVMKASKRGSYGSNPLPRTVKLRVTQDCTIESVEPDACNENPTELGAALPRNDSMVQTPSMYACNPTGQDLDDIFQ